MIVYAVTDRVHDILMAVYTYSTEEAALKCVEGILKKYQIGHLEPDHHIKTAVVEIHITMTLLDAH